MKKIFVASTAAITMVFSVIPVSATKADAGTGTGTSRIVIHLRITAYSSTPDQTDETPFITASGVQVRDGIVATNILPFGTQVQIPKLFGDKIFTVQDRMAKRMTNVMDIWMSTREKALRFGVAHADVLVVPPTLVVEPSFASKS